MAARPPPVGTGVLVPSPRRGLRAALGHYLSNSGWLEIPNALCMPLCDLTPPLGWQAEGTGSPPLGRRGASSRKGSPRFPGSHGTSGGPAAVCGPLRAAAKPKGQAVRLQRREQTPG